MSDEVYAFFEDLSKKRKLTKALIEWAESEVAKEVQHGSLNRVLEEISEIKQLIVSGTLKQGTSSHLQLDRGQEHQDKLLVELSSNEIQDSLDDDDTEYDF